MGGFVCVFFAVVVVVCLFSFVLLFVYYHLDVNRLKLKH